MRFWLSAGLGVVVLLATPGIVWVSLTHQPAFYRQRVELPRAERKREAEQFVRQSLQLRNDICNEPSWEAVFTDQEVNAWLAEDLVTHFAEQLPPEVHEPRVVFEDDRVTLAFLLDRGPIRSVVWVVARVRVPEPNLLALTLEKIRAGVIPLPAEQIIDRITQQARLRGLEVRWESDGNRPVALIRYTPNPDRSDVILDQLHIRAGQIRLAGRSNRFRGAVATPTLPKRKVLQSTFPRRNTQPPDDADAPPPTFHSSAVPTS